MKHEDSKSCDNKYIIAYFKLVKNEMAEILKSSDLKEVKTMNYDLFYRLTPVFINDLKKTLNDVAYVDAQKLLSKIETLHGIFPVAILNEFLADLRNLPYGIVSPLMAVINQKEYFVQYFEEIDLKKLEEKEKELRKKEEAKKNHSSETENK